MDHEQVLDQIYAAAVDDSALYELFDWLATSTGSRGAGAYAISAGRMTWERSAGMPADFMETFARDYAPADPRIQYLTDWPLLSVHSDAEPTIRRAMHETPVAQFVESNDLPYTAGMLLTREGSALSSLYISRSFDQGPPKNDLLTLLGRYGPHLARSMRLRNWHRSIEHAFLSPASGEAAPGRILLDHTGRIRWRDERSEQMLQVSKAARVIGGRIKWRCQRLQDWMDKALAGARCAHRPDWQMQPIGFSAPSGHLDLTVTPAQVPAELPAPLLEPARGWLMMALQWRDCVEPVTVRLTARQQEVLEALARGLTTPAIARELDCATNTVRNHVQALLDKLEASNRIDLVNRARRLRLVKTCE